MAIPTVICEMCGRKKAKGCFCNCTGAQILIELFDIQNTIVKRIENLRRKIRLKFAESFQERMTKKSIMEMTEEGLENALTEDIEIDEDPLFTPLPIRKKENISSDLFKEIEKNAAEYLQLKDDVEKLKRQVKILQAYAPMEKI